MYAQISLMKYIIYGDHSILRSAKNYKTCYGIKYNGMGATYKETHKEDKEKVDSYHGEIQPVQVTGWGIQIFIRLIHFLYVTRSECPWQQYRLNFCGNVRCGGTKSKVSYLKFCIQLPPQLISLKVVFSYSLFSFIYHTHTKARTETLRRILACLSMHWWWSITHHHAIRNKVY